PTAAVHEAYVRLYQQGAELGVHFLAAACSVARHILADYARRRGAAKRVDLDDLVNALAPRYDQLLMLDEALSRLAEWSARQARLVETIYFCGLMEREAASALEISELTVKRDWSAARAWLQPQPGGSEA